MGDGHHGWAAAEIALALHDAFIFEINNKKQKEVVMLQGIPKEWFLNSSTFYIKNTPFSDGTVDIVDALLVAQYYVGLNPSPFNQDAADANCDGNVDIIDALLIARYYVGLISGFC